MDKNKFLFIALFVIAIYSINSVNASLFIIGYVNDSFDGKAADGYKVFLWNNAHGINDNITDIIGNGGNSGASNFYMIDCDMLNSSCNVGDVLSVRVINALGEYMSRTVNVSVTGAGYEMVENIRINSNPNVSLISPINYANVSSQLIFNCSANDPDGNLDKISLYANFSGQWSLNETKNISGASNSSVFIKNPNDGRYIWGCKVYDELLAYNHSINRTVTYDNVAPNVDAIYINETKICGITTNVRVSCNTSDSLSGIYNVTIKTISNSSLKNYTTFYAGGNRYYSDILLNESGIWNFSCASNDNAGNINNSIYSFDRVFDSVVNLFVNYIDIIFDKNNPIEDELININVTVKNDGCMGANNVLVGFYEGNPQLGGSQISNNQTGSVSKGGNSTFSVPWSAKIGLTNVYVALDINNSINEMNETDNVANRSISVASWHMFYGNITSDRVLADYGINNISLWLNDTNSSGNVYASDVESSINWASLVALGVNKTDGSSVNDFSELDNSFLSSNYIDSISKVYTYDGNTPRNTTSFLVSNKFVNNVPIVNTTSNYNFFTGILWDASDDSNGQYDDIEKEDIIFLTKINRNSLGSFGVYDYELNVPSKLREYKQPDDTEVYLYFDLN